MVVPIHRRCRAIALLVALLASHPAHAADPAAPPTAPTPSQLARAKQAFADARALHDAGKLAEAIEKLKLSYELSRNPLLLYDIGLTMQELGSDDLAVVYYRKFLAEAPADAARRADAADRIAALSRKLAAPTTVPPPAADEPPPPPPPPRASLEHHPVEAAPPGQPLDLTAVIPDDAHLAVTLFFRTAGQAAFTSTPLVPRDHELVGRIPAARVIGRALQYYLEARDPSGALVARSGKSTVPNVVALDPAAPPRFYPDVAEPVLSPVAPGDRDAEDPLAHRAAPAPGGSGDGVLDVGSRRFAAAKWTSTALAGASITAGITLYVLARDHAHALEDDATGCGAPPCQRFDDFDRDIERTGKLEQTLSNAAVFGGLAVAAVAGYLWYRELTWQIVPTASARFTGATAAVRF